VYALIRPLLFALDPETSHHLTLKLLHGATRLPGGTRILRAFSNPPVLPVNVLGLHFPNPVGLAAGLDKEACCAGAFHALGFGFVELGTVTPRPQPGNPRPRLFRLPRQEAILNRMGFNSGGLETFLANLRAGGHPGLIGINLGKNRDTPAEDTTGDYLTGLRAVYASADYITVNISSPNTPGLRALQDEAPLSAMLAALKAEQGRLAAAQHRYVPLALKIAPDLADEAIDTIARLLIAHRIDAVIATNTTVTRPGLDGEPLARESGGLSGRPLQSLSTHVVRRLYATLRGQVPIIGVGGILNADDAWEKMLAGAELVQIYSALIYRGPGVVRAVAEGLVRRVRESGATSLSQALARQRTMPGA
jgi:dihydroorotate dehydrogenase